MKVLDLFAGLKGWSQPFEDRGHDVVSVEIDRKFPGISLYADILDLSARDFLPWRPDIVLASPPCTAFTVMQIGRNWTKDHQPKTEAARHGLRLVDKTVELIHDLGATYNVIENPRAKLRKMPVMQRFERRTVTYCQYGETRMKPTDLWGGAFPPTLVLKAPCKNGMPCHVAAPRGSTTGTQGMDSATSAKIPYALALAVCIAAEVELGLGIPQLREAA